MCSHSKIQAANQTCYLIQPQYTQWHEASNSLHTTWRLVGEGSHSNATIRAALIWGRRRATTAATTTATTVTDDDDDDDDNNDD